MLYIKDGYPEINEIVMCTVTRIYGNTTFVNLDEYDKEGVLIISEIAPGRIRNLRDYVVENKKIVCKVLRTDEKQKRIDVSLRRVSIPVMKDKLEEIKKEEYSDRVYEEVSYELKISKDKLFEKTYEVIFDNYRTVFEALYDIMLENSKINLFKNLNEKEKETLIKVINSKIKPEHIFFKSKFTIISLASNGIEIVKDTISKVLDKLSYDKVSIVYVAAGEFEIKIQHEDMKSANVVFNKFKEEIQKESKNNQLELKI